MAYAVSRVLLHGAAASIMTYGYRGLGSLAIDAYMQSQYGGHFQYLTIQGLAVAWLTMISSLLIDAFPSFKGALVVKRYLMVMAMPLAVVISLVYWTLLIFFPTLILPSDLAESTVPSSSSDTAAPFRLPLSLDLSLHAAPALAIILDFFIFEKKYNKKEIHVGVPCAVSAYALSYGLWVEHCAKHNHGIFPYPFLTENNLPIRLGIYAGATILAIASFKLFNDLHL